MSIGAALQEAVNQRLTERGPTVQELLEEVGLSAEDATRRPGSFSGGSGSELCWLVPWRCRRSFWCWTRSVAALDLRIQAEILGLLLGPMSAVG